mgnify:CR=1 FL=1
MSDTTELVKLSAAEMAARVKAGEVSSQGDRHRHLPEAGPLDGAEGSCNGVCRRFASPALFGLIPGCRGQLRHQLGKAVKLLRSVLRDRRLCQDLIILRCVI